MKKYSIFLILFAAGFCTIDISAQTSVINNISTPTNDASIVSAGSSKLKLSDHPRLFFSRGEENAILTKAKTNPLLSQIIDVLKKEADKELSAVPQIYKPDTELLAVSREQDKRMVTLAMAYRLFKDSRYANKVEEELVNVSRFPSWHPEHFLDVAEMTTAVAIGYDWCYDYLSESTRTAVENAIRENGFGPSWPLLKITDKQTPFNRENNWNMVCNSGILNGAIAIGDKYPDDLKLILQYAVKNTPNLLVSFAPEGVFNEGPSYWGYNGMYMSLFFDNLNRNIHNDYGLTKYKGLENTGNYYKSIIGPTNRNYGFADGSEGVDRSGTFFLLSKLYKRPEVAEFYRNQITVALKEYNAKGSYEFPRYFFLSIPWYDDAEVSRHSKEDKLTIFNGVTDFLIFNADSLSNKNRLWLAAKTGRPSWSHNHLDVGSFVVDCDSERWAIDLGPDDYSLPNFWDFKPGGVRWSYFRNNNLAHNTLTIDDKIANSEGQGELIKSNKNAATPFGIFDISSSYPDEATSVLRGFKLLSPNAIMVRDEVTLKPGSKKVAWRFLTNADVKVEGNTATLTQNNKKFYIQCLLNYGYNIKVFPAKPNTAGEKPIKNVSIVEITVQPKDKTVTIPVVMGREISNVKSTTDINLSLNKWK